ncbi:MAG: hypothetical protein AAF492_08200 [Verrucomicrobiota bacterium]
MLFGLFRITWKSGRWINNPIFYLGFNLLFWFAAVFLWLYGTATIAVLSGAMD